MFWTTAALGQRALTGPSGTDRASLARASLAAAEGSTSLEKVVLLDSSPSAFAELSSRPADIVLHFDRPVRLSPLSIRVLAVGGAGVGTGPAFHPAGRPDDIAERLRALRPGTYLVAWQATASGQGARAGRASGGYWFTLLGTGPNAHPPASTGNVRAILAELDAPRPDPAVTVLYWVTRLLGLGATMVLVGMGAALCLLWPEGWSRRFSLIAPGRRAELFSSRASPPSG